MVTVAPQVRGASNAIDRNAADALLRGEILDIQIPPPRQLTGEQSPLASHVLVSESVPVGGLIVPSRNLATHPCLKEALIRAAAFRNFGGF
jgi:hypothetical protein